MAVQFWGGLFLVILGSLISAFLYSAIQKRFTKAWMLVGFVHGQYEAAIHIKPSAGLAFGAGSDATFCAIAQPVSGGVLRSCEVRFLRPTWWRIARYIGSWGADWDTLPPTLAKPLTLTVHGLGAHPPSQSDGLGGLVVEFTQAPMWSVPTKIYIEVQSRFQEPCAFLISLRAEVELRKSIVRRAATIVRR